MLIYDIISLSLQGEADVLLEKIKTLYSVVFVFIDAFNRFGLAKYKYRQRKKNGELPFSVVDFL